MDKIINWLAKPKNLCTEDTLKVKMIFYGAILTSPLMFLYAWIAKIHIINAWPARVGYFASFIHILSPLLCKWTKNHLFIISILLFAGFSHQATFAFFSGGFKSSIIIWFAVLPVIASIVTGWQGTILWATISIIATLGFAIAEYNHFAFPNEISPEGFLLAQNLISFGMIVLNAFLIYLFLDYHQSTQSKLQIKNNSISDLLRILIHDIANPLMAAKIRIEKVFQNFLNDDQQLNLNKSLKALNDINEIIQSTRSAYLLQNELNKLSFQLTNFSELLEDVIDGFDHPLKLKNIQIKIRNKLPPSYSIKINQSSIKYQLLANLISNAIKFSNKDSKIMIDLDVIENFLQISIQDFGVGIPEKHINHLFDIAIQKQREGTSGEQGTGFGLHLAYKTVFAHHGQITVHSQNLNTNQISGTTFVIHLPTNL